MVFSQLMWTVRAAHGNLAKPFFLWNFWCLALQKAGFMLLTDTSLSFVNTFLLAWSTLQCKCFVFPGWNWWTSRTKVLVSEVYLFMMQVIPPLSAGLKLLLLVLSCLKVLACFCCLVRFSGIFLMWQQSSLFGCLRRILSFIFLSLWLLC